MTAQLYDCREAARSLLGDKYTEKMRELAQVISAVSKRDKCNEIVAGATVIKAVGLEGVSLSLLLAAIVEMVEPS